MRVGHSRRAWNTFFGMHEQGVWVAFFDCCDVGFGGDRVGIRRCIAAMEMPTGVEAVCVPVEAVSRGPNLLQTAIDYLSFVPVSSGAGLGRDASPVAAEGSGRKLRTHQLYVRRPSAANSPLVRQLMETIAGYSADCVWELGENVVLVGREVPRAEPTCSVVAVLLDAVAAVAGELTAVQESSMSPVPSRDSGIKSPAVRGVVGVLPRDDRLLVIRRAAHILAGGAWCFPGGAIEPGESPADAVVREMEEEVGLAIRPLRELWQCTLDDGRLLLHWWLVAPATPDHYNLRLNPAEVAEAQWLTPTKILSLPGLLDSNREFLQHSDPTQPRRD